MLDGKQTQPRRYARRSMHGSMVEHHFDLLHIGQCDTEIDANKDSQDTNKKIIQNDLAKSNIGLIISRNEDIVPILCVSKVWTVHIIQLSKSDSWHPFYLS